MLLKSIKIFCLTGIIFFGFNSIVSGQGFVFGYQVGKYTFGLRDLQTYMFNYNHNNDLTKEYKFSNYNRGFSFGMDGLTDDNYYYNVMFHNKHQKFEAVGKLEGTSERLRTRMNYIDVAVGKKYKFFLPGMSMEAGYFSILNKHWDDTLSWWHVKYTSCYFIGATVFTEIIIPSKAVLVHLRPYYQFNLLSIAPVEHDGIWKFYHHYNYANVGIALYISVGNYDN